VVTEDLQIWLNHFEYHAQHPRSVPPGLPDRLQSDERQLIAGSIATFQLAEQSEGASLLGAAQAFARCHDSPALVRIVELFIREQQRHATLLRAFMQDHAIAPKLTDWTERVFRCVRRLAGLELYLNVLITAELIGIAYYRGLESATGCQRLKVLCRSLVSDEFAHVGFASHLLLALRARHVGPVRALVRRAHRAFLVGSACMIWLAHRRVLRRGGYSARGFIGACQAQFAFYLEPATLILASSGAR
jgi:hypothetical protein